MTGKSVPKRAGLAELKRSGEKEGERHYHANLEGEKKRQKDKELPTSALWPGKNDNYR